MIPIAVVFLQKAWKEKKRHPFRQIFITIVPFIMLIAMLTSQFRHKAPEVTSPESTIDQDDLADNLPGEFTNRIFYTPQTNVTESLVEEMRNILGVEEERIVPFKDALDLEYEMLDTESICYGIIFQNVSDDGHLQYTIRTKNNNFRSHETYSMNVFNVYKQRDDEYIKSGFLAIQNAIDRAYMSYLSKETNVGQEKLGHVSLRYGHIPVDESRGPNNPTTTYYVLIWYVAISSFASIYLLLLPLVEERACGANEYLKIACSVSYWNEVVIFFFSFVHVFGILLLSLFFCLGSIWESNLAQVSYLVLLYILYLVNLIAFVFLVSATLESPTVAIGVAPICLFFPVLLGSIFKSFNLALCAFPVNGFYTGGNIFLNFKSSGHIFKAHDLYTRMYPSYNGISLSSVYLMLILGIFVWAFLWFYVTNVFPGRYGTPKSKGFFLSKNYWRQMRTTFRECNGIRPKNRVLAESQRELQHQNLDALDNIGYRGDVEIVVSEHVEEKVIGNHLEPVLQIKGLYKTYKGHSRGAKTKMAVKDFSISIYRHSITVLLGHNGAGKTTTMNIITGMVPRDNGSIVVDGEEDPNRYRQRIGFCPQHNVFYSYLNCREHLLFYGRLRGLNAKNAIEQADIVLNKVNLHDKRNEFVHTLSGGMKRRLSLANAIIGHTKLLILDEPTSGLDPESRRDIWDLLLKLRQDHTILLTTHFMEEADILGDWIAIMEYGELVAFGTPLYLKQKYGKGYTLKLQKVPGFDENRTLDLVQQYVPSATERDSVQEVFAVTLPYDSMDQYSSLLSTLEAQQQELAIEAISMSNATLEDVFLNSSKANKVFQHHQESEDRVDSPLKMPPSSSNPSQRPSDILSRATLNTCVGIWRKKLIHMRCNFHIYGSLLSLPVLVTLLCFSTTTAFTDVATALPAVMLNSFNIRHALGLITINGPQGSGVGHPMFNKETILANTRTVGGMRLQVLENVSLDASLHQLIDEDYTEYRDRLVVGIECNVSEDNLAMTILHNNNLLHSSGIGETIAATMLLRYYLGLPDAEVQVQNIPSTRKLLIDTGTPFFYTELVSFAFMFYILIYMQVPLLEHQTGFRQLQNINRYIYWGSTYAFDVAIHIVVCAVVIVLTTFLDSRGVFSSTMYVHISFAILLYGMQALLVVYIISMCVENANTALTIMSYLMIIGVGGVFLLSNEYDDIMNNSLWIGILHLVPEFALKHSMHVIYENQKLIIFEKHSADNERRMLSLHTMYIVPIVLIPLLVIILNEILENIYWREKVVNTGSSILRYVKRIFSIPYHILCARNRDASNHSHSEEPSRELQTISSDETDGSLMRYVNEESETVVKILDDTSGEEEREKYAIVVRELHKAYFDEHDAVKRISFAVKKGECFGLLGMNGAGKTTVFQMLSRNLPISSGEIYLRHYEVQQANALEYRLQYGYCPQVDMLLDFLTVYQTINYFSRIKNIPDRERHIMHWLTVFDILAYKDHAVGECSGGTKRKINTIIALLGCPSVVLLDEPTTGVDPKSRRFLWKCIKAIQRKDQAILLTSHSMDECEELCNRLSIMVHGSLRCIGSILQLKQRHGQGYTVLLKLNDSFVTGDPDNYKSLSSDIQRRLGAAEIIEHRKEYKGMLKFAVDPSWKLSELFRQVHELKKSRGEDITSYSINETSFEDIFMKFRHKTTEC